MTVLYITSVYIYILYFRFIGLFHIHRSYYFCHDNEVIVGMFRVGNELLFLLLHLDLLPFNSLYSEILYPPICYD